MEMKRIHSPLGIFVSPLLVSPAPFLANVFGNFILHFRNGEEEGSMQCQ